MLFYGYITPGYRNVGGGGPTSITEDKRQLVNFFFLDDHRRCETHQWEEVWREQKACTSR